MSPNERADGLLIGYMERPDFEEAYTRMAVRKAKKRWQDQMAEFFEIPKGGDAGRTDAALLQGFHLD
jgi:L-rhamnose mutarotase